MGRCDGVNSLAATVHTLDGVYDRAFSDYGRPSRGQWIEFGEWEQSACPPMDRCEDGECK